MIWIKGNNKKNHTSWQKNQCPGKKKGYAPRNMIELSMVYDKIQTENGFSELSTTERQEI